MLCRRQLLRMKIGHQIGSLQIRIIKRNWYNYRYNMSDVTHNRSFILSKLLNEVTGTEEAIRIRQDYCRIADCIKSMALPLHMRMHFTGSRSEGLNLFDSDEDFMIDINDAGDSEVVQSFR